MATCFDRWEKDPFFPAAEEVQESADRMESAYRRWIREKDAPSHKSEIIELRELQTALGTAKWQLDELSKAVKASDDACSAGEERRSRHDQFVEAIGNQISIVENSLKESRNENVENEISWVKLDKHETDELALFLACPLPPLDKSKGTIKKLNENAKGNMKDERVSGHRRTASADVESWKIVVSNDEMPNKPPPRIPSLSCLANDLQSTIKDKLPTNVFRKLKGSDLSHQDGFETIPLRNTQLSRDCNACYEKTKSCLSSCGNDAYEKELYGWFGALQRQLQRSQYQIQYGRPFQSTVWVVLVVLFIVFIAFQAI